MAQTARGLSRGGYRMTRRGWPSSEVSRPLLPLSPANGGAPGTGGSAARAGEAGGALSLGGGAISSAFGGASATRSRGAGGGDAGFERSEERRVGKGWGARGAADG